MAPHAINSTAIKFWRNTAFQKANRRMHIKSVEKSPLSLHFSLGGCILKDGLTRTVTGLSLWNVQKKFLCHGPAGDDLTQISVPVLKTNVRHESLSPLSNIIPKLDKKMVICNMTRCSILQFYFFFIPKNPATSAAVRFPDISAAWIASF